MSQAEQLCEVLTQEGPEFLAAWRAPMLSWPELQALKAEAAAGKAIEAAPPGARRAHAMQPWRMRACASCTRHMMRTGCMQGLLLMHFVEVQTLLCITLHCRA